MSGSTFPNHNDAASALMALAGNSEKTNPETGTAVNSPLEDSVSTHSPPKPNNNTAALPANRFPEKV